jgi:hypothetical protein
MKDPIDIYNTVTVIATNLLQSEVTSLCLFTRNLVGVIDNYLETSVH